jgi:hypothetical protein
MGETMTNEQRDRMLKAVWGDTSRIRKHPEGYWAEPSVTCFHCGKTVTDPQRTKAEIRRQLRKEGWKVSVEGFRSMSGGGNYGNYKRLDFCGHECFENSFEKLEDEYHRAEMKQALFGFVPSSKPN